LKLGKLKKLPYGISDYKTIVEKEYLYVERVKAYCGAIQGEIIKQIFNN
jgi:hypothetical protein